MTELEFTQKMDQALLVGEDHARKVADKLLHGAKPITYLWFTKYCREFLVNEDKYELRDATPRIRRELTEKYSKLVQILELFIELDEFSDVADFNSILGELKIDL